MNLEELKEVLYEDWFPEVLEKETRARIAEMENEAVLKTVQSELSCMMIEKLESE